MSSENSCNWKILLQSSGYSNSSFSEYEEQTEK